MSAHFRFIAKQKTRADIHHDVMVQDLLINHMNTSSWAAHEGYSLKFATRLEGLRIGVRSCDDVHASLRWQLEPRNDAIEKEVDDAIEVTLSFHRAKHVWDA